MLLMKKDMGGAANALGLAHMIMEAGLPVRLRVLIPAVENAIAGAAFRPGDVLRSRKGLTVEIGNTDAEGRLVLADALTLAGEESPDLLVDLATLTGAARVALGPEVVPFYTHDDALAADLAAMGQAVADPLWRMPLWEPYRVVPRFEDRRHQQCQRQQLCRLDHRGAFPGALRAARDELVPRRHLRLEPVGQAWPARRAARRRRSARSTRYLAQSLRRLEVSACTGLNSSGPKRFE